MGIACLTFTKDVFHNHQYYLIKIQICQIDRSIGAYVVVGASSSVKWTFMNGSATNNHFTVTYGDGDETSGGKVIPRYV